MAWFGDRVVLLALVAVAGASLWLRIDTSLMPEVSRFRDDAYYFFSWARSLAAGDGPCVTPGVATNGVQLLWAFLLALCASVVGPDMLPQAAHVLGIAIHLVTGWLIGWSLRGRGRVAWCGALVYLANPFLITEAQNGQETSLACLAAAALLAAYRGGDRTFLAAALLAPLARADLFVLVPFLAWARYRWSVRALLVPVAALCVYAAVNLAVAGRVFQDSSSPIPWLFEQHFLASEPELRDHAGRLWWWLRPCLLGGPWGLVSPWLAGILVFMAARRWCPWRWRLLPLLMTGLAWVAGAEDLAVPVTAGALLALIPAGDDEDLPFMSLVLGWAVILFLHHVVRLYPRPYYFAPMGAAMVMALVVFQARLPRIGGVLVLLIGGAQLVDAARPAMTRGWQEESRMAGQLMREFIGPGEPVGCFNAGLVGYLDAGPVVNLDGVVNRGAFDALRSGDLNGYLDRLGVRYLVDVPVQFRLDDPWPHASGRHFGPEFDPSRDLLEVARFDVPGVAGDAPGTESVRLYWRVGRGDPPRAALWLWWILPFLLTIFPNNNIFQNEIQKNN